jgi:hypothetical protein
MTWLRAALERVVGAATEAFLQFASWSARGTSYWTLALVILPLLILSLPPTGQLSGNEEAYFAIADHYFTDDLDTVPQPLLGGMPHTIAFALIANPMIEGFGYELTQIIGRLLTAVLYALALASLFARLGLNVLEALLVVGVFIVADQALVGHEWMLYGFEPKTLAYPALLFALSQFLSDRPARTFVWLAVATTVHVQVGAMWFVFVCAAWFIDGLGWRRLVPGALLYSLLIVPIAWIVLSQHANQLIPGASVATGSEPTTDWIVTYEGFPQFAHPFVTRWELLHWLPGLCLMIAILPVIAAIGVRTTGSERRLAWLNVVVLAFLAVATVITALDPSGWSGRLLLFRPGGPLLLTCLLQLVLALRHLIADADRVRAVAVAVLLTLAIGVPVTAAEKAGDIVFRHKTQQRTAEVVAFIHTQTPGSSTLLIEPRLEKDFLSLPRVAERHALVLFQFLPSRDPDILEWYRRRQFQARLFAEGCAAVAGYEVDYLIASTPTAHSLAASCGQVVLVSDQFAVVRIEPDRAPVTGAGNADIRATGRAPSSPSSAIHAPLSHSS